MRKSRAIVLDSLLTYDLSRRANEFSRCKKKESFNWGELLYEIANGERINRQPKLKWLKDVDVLYVPLNWSQEHWVGLSIHLKMRHVTIYDPLVSKTREIVVKTRMQPILAMMPYLLKAVCKDYVGEKYSLDPFTYFRVDCISQNPRTGDCGPFSMKFMELLMLGRSMEELQTIEEADMDNYRKGYAVDIFEHGVRSLT